jgi:hypothetical protein
MTEMAALANVGDNIQDRQASSSSEISNERFIGQLDQLRQLKQFLFEETARFKADEIDSLDFGSLNNLQYASNGRVPSVIEWRSLDEKLSVLGSYLTDDLRRKIRIRALSVFFRVLPLTFLIASILATIVNMMLGSLFRDAADPAFFFLWLVTAITWATAQGGLGACAFLGTSVILKTSQNNVDKDKNTHEIVDLTDRNFLSIRVILGTLFAVLLGLPFLSKSLTGISSAITQGFVEYSGSNPSSDTAAAHAGGGDFSSLTLIYMMIPFVVGYSTNLVIVILSRFVIAIESFFGLSGRT